MPQVWDSLLFGPSFNMKIETTIEGVIDFSTETGFEPGPLATHLRMLTTRSRFWFGV